MTALTATLLLRDVSGMEVGNLSIAALPRCCAPEDRTTDPTRSRTQPPIQLREASSYRYTLDLPGVSGARLEPAELFDPDDSSAMTGRLHTRQYVGDVAVNAIDPDGDVLGSAVFLVRAAKLEHEREYQRMLRDIADLAAEAVLQGFAPSTMRTAISASRAPRVLYQQFAILQARLNDEELQDAIAHVVHRPQRGWVLETEWRAAGRPLKGGGDIVRALTAPGRRVRAVVSVASLETLPGSIQSNRSEETVDTVPNRFVKFALTHWRGLAARLADLLRSRSRTAYGVRGAAAVDGVLEALDEVLSEPFFSQIGQLRELPTSNQVLLKSDGYRQIFSTFALIESGLDLRLELDDAIQPSQRNIASLYEYWTFLRLAEIVGSMCGDVRAPLRLFEQDRDGLSLGLKRGTESKLRWDVSVAGRLLGVSVYFNRTFRMTDDHRSDGSWSRSMIPDASVLIRPVTGRTLVESERDLDVWLHFDAKYKLDWASSQFERVRPEREEEVAREEEDQERIGRSRREDLLKMHAYRDAIRRSAGAYVLFPGSPGRLEFREYVELIPGLGAFPLRPGSDAGLAALRRFFHDVLLHAADQATAEERSRYWQAAIFHESAAPAREQTVDFLRRPPRDTAVLVDHVQDQSLWQWIEQTKQYVVRLGGRGVRITFRAEELAAPLVLLAGGERVAIFERWGPWTIVDQHDLRALQHPDAFEPIALLCELIPIANPPPWLRELQLTDVLARSRIPGEPVLAMWSALVERRARPALTPGRPTRRHPPRFGPRDAGQSPSTPNTSL
jgi:predicted component of viral defense system (DUF524 family)